MEEKFIIELTREEVVELMCIIDLYQASFDAEVQEEDFFKSKELAYKVRRCKKV